MNKEQLNKAKQKLEYNIQNQIIMSKEGDNGTQFNSNFDINSPKIPLSQNDKIHGRMYDSYSNTSVKNTI